MINYSSQQQSILFRLPRELRDEIYSYYAFEEAGYLYDFPSQRLRFANGRTLSLTYTCKAVAEEIQAASLRTNTITFIASDAATDEGRFRGLHSRAARFEHLVFCTRWTKMVMLHFVAEHVTDYIIERVMQSYPSINNTFRVCFSAIRRGLDIGAMTRRPHHNRDMFSASFCDAVQYTLDLVSAEAEFAELISKACRSTEYYPANRSYFIQGSHHQIFKWRPDPWSIPSDEELVALESFLTEPQTADEFDCARDYQSLRFYFSATAVCIATLSRLTPTARKHVRTIDLREDCKGVSNPEAHADGLIPFCVENPKLRILIHAGLSTNLVPSLWAKPNARSPQPWAAKMALPHDYLCVIIDWLLRTASLPERGMPSGSLAAILDASSDEATSLWRQIERAAAAREILPEAIENSEREEHMDIGILQKMYGQYGASQNSYHTSSEI